MGSLVKAVLSMDSTGAFLGRVSIFGSLNSEALEELGGFAKVITREAGQVVFREGDPPDAMYIVRSGRVAISVWTVENEELVVSVLGEGDFFGETYLLDGFNRTATAKALESVVLIQILSEEFFKLIKLHPGVGISILQVMARRLRAANEIIERRASRNVNQEVEKTLTVAERVADLISRWGGSWSFIGLFFVVLMIWVAVNTLNLFVEHFDAYPYAFLNFLLAVLAALQAPIIMMSQNRDAQIDRLRADLDYQVNLKAELQIQSLHVKLDDLRISEIHELREIQRQQLELIKKQKD